MNLQRILKLIGALIDVEEVSLMNPESSVVRELLLVRIEFRKESLSEELREILGIVNSLKCNVIDLNDKSITFEHIGDSNKLDSLIRIFRRFNVKELSRTGEAAVHQ